MHFIVQISLDWALTFGIQKRVFQVRNLCSNRKHDFESPYSHDPGIEP